VSLPLRCLLLFALMFSAVVGPCAPLVDAGQRIRLVSYNCELLSAPDERVTIQKYRFNLGRYRQFERIAAVIESLDPDIISLQEVTSKESVDLLVKILHEKGLTDYRGYHVDGHDNFMKLDVACISKFEPDEIEGERIRCIWSPREEPQWRETFTYPRDDASLGSSSASIDRNALCFFTIGEAKLGLLGLHLKSNPSDDYSNGRRSAEAEVARRIVQQEIVARGYTPIVVGDFNDYDPDVPDRDESRSTKTDVLRTIKDFDPEREGYELTNIASKIKRQADRYTSHWDRNENRADDYYDVKTMLDHILLHQSLLPGVKRVFIDHSQCLETSDHFPVVVDLELPEDES